MRVYQRRYPLYVAHIIRIIIYMYGEICSRGRYTCTWLSSSYGNTQFTYTRAPAFMFSETNFVFLQC